jgi:hypothetical protein
MKVVGTIVYEEIEGGFWGIKGDDGDKYKPVSGLPENAQKAGQRVEAELERVQVMGISMWGKAVKVNNLELLP